MGANPNIVELMNWLSLVFPSLAQYSKVMMPMIIAIIGVISVFSNILPKPGELYPLPTLEDLEIEMKGNGRFTYATAKISRSITIFVNKIIATKCYDYFFKITKFCSIVIKKVKGQAGEEKAVGITTPKPYSFKRLRQRLNKEKDQDM